MNTKHQAKAWCNFKFKKALQFNVRPLNSEREIQTLRSAQAGLEY